MSVASGTMTSMRITKEDLIQAWQRKAAGSDVLDDAMFPPVIRLGDHHEPLEDFEPGKLYVGIGDDGLVRGFEDEEEEIFAADDLDLALYFIAEEVTRILARKSGPGVPPSRNAVVRHAELLDRIDPVWGRRFRTGGTDDTATVEPCGLDPIDGFAWIAGGWRDQAPYTNLTFYRGENISFEDIALFHGAHPDDVAAGVQVSDLPALLAEDGGPFASSNYETFCFGQAGEWAYLLYHDTPPRGGFDKERYDRLGITERVLLSACLGKAIYTFDYMRDGVQVDDDRGMLELIWYDAGRPPYRRGGDLDFLNRALRRAELDHPDVTGEFQLYFHALETSLGIGLPRDDIERGTARGARWAGRAA